MKKTYYDIMFEIKSDIDNNVRYRNEPLTRMKLRGLGEKLVVCHMLGKDPDQKDLDLLVENGYIKLEKGSDNKK